MSKQITFTIQEYSPAAVLGETSVHVTTTDKFTLNELRLIENIFRNNKHKILTQATIKKKEKPENAKTSIL